MQLVAYLCSSCRHFAKTLLAVSSEEFVFQLPRKGSRRVIGSVAVPVPKAPPVPVCDAAVGAALVPIPAKAATHSYIV